MKYKARKEIRQDIDAQVEVGHLDQNQYGISFSFQYSGPVRAMQVNIEIERDGTTAEFERAFLPARHGLERLEMSLARPRDELDGAVVTISFRDPRHGGVVYRFTAHDLVDKHSFLVEGEELNEARRAETKAERRKLKPADRRELHKQLNPTTTAKSPTSVYVALPHDTGPRGPVRVTFDVVRLDGTMESLRVPVEVPAEFRYAQFVLAGGEIRAESVNQSTVKVRETLPPHATAISVATIEWLDTRGPVVADYTDLDRSYSLTVAGVEVNSVRIEATKGALAI